MKITKCNELENNISRIQNMIQSYKDMPVSNLEGELIEELECLLSYFETGNPKVIVEVEGGLVSSVQSTDPDQKVMIIDRDMEGADDDEIGSYDDIDMFIDGDDIYPVLTENWNSMISDVSYDNLIK